MFFRKLFLAPTVVRLVILQTLAVVAIVVPSTWLIASVVCVYLNIPHLPDPQAVVRFVTWLSLAECLGFGPLLSAPSASALRRLGGDRAQLERLADTDPLTGLLNRRGLEKAARKLMAEAQARGVVVAALVCDIDKFKRVNDLHGHGVGDLTLRALADLMRARFAAEAAAVARIGGEEFVALVVAPNPRAAEATAEDLRRAFAERDIVAANAALRCTLSVGVAAAPAPCVLDALIERADAALYRAKSAGRNRIVAAAA